MKTPVVTFALATLLVLTGCVNGRFVPPDPIGRAIFGPREDPYDDRYDRRTYYEDDRYDDRYDGRRYVAPPPRSRYY